MHPSALRNAKQFFQTYLSDRPESVIVEIGSQDVNGSLRNVAPPNVKYLGVDFVVGKGVDVVIDDPYKLPFDDESIDAVVTSSCLEHSEMFWVLFLEILRILRPSGLLYINVPTNADFHRYPVDCWRFYPDSGDALVTWGKRNGLNPLLLESYVDKKHMGIWNDYVAVFLKDETKKAMYPNRILQIKDDYYNGRVAEKSGFLNLCETTEDQSNIADRLKRGYWERMYKATISKIETDE